MKNPVVTTFVPTAWPLALAYNLRMCQRKRREIFKPSHHYVKFTLLPMVFGYQKRIYFLSSALS